MEGNLRPSTTTAGSRPPLRTGSDIDDQQAQTFESPPVIWAIDAFPDEREVNLRTASVLHQLYPDTPIHPVYVLSEESFTDRGFSTFLRPALKPMALKAMNTILNESQDQGALTYRKPRVLMETSASRPACARKFMRYAERIGARMIVLGSHGRKGFSRFLVGSFSEAIINHSHLPVVIAGPNLEKLRSTPRLIVFPTDFTPACRAALPDILKLADQFDAEIHFFHKELHVIDPLVQSGVHLLGGGWVSMEPYMTPMSQEHVTESKDWVRRAEAAGIKAQFVGENFSEPTSEAIVQYVRNMMSASPILAMVSQTGPVASRLLGSVTRDVIRMSPCPVYLASHEPSETRNG